MPANTPDSQSIAIESILQESRMFPPPPEFAARAHVRSIEEYEEITQKPKVTRKPFGRATPINSAGLYVETRSYNETSFMQGGSSEALSRFGTITLILLTCGGAVAGAKVMNNLRRRCAIMLPKRLVLCHIRTKCASLMLCRKRADHLQRAGRFVVNSGTLTGNQRRLRNVYINHAV